MSDTHHDTPSRDGTPPARLPVHEAARLLGISDNAVRARLRRGTLAGVKHGASWYVLIRDTDIPPAQTAVHQERPGDAPEHTAAHVDLGPLAEVIRDQNRRLEELAAAAAMWQSRAAHLENELKQLAAGEIVPQTVPEPPGSPQTSDTGPRRILVWLRRLWSPS